MSGRKVRNDDTTPPQDPAVGRLFYDQVLERMRRWNGKEWVDHKPGYLAGQTGSD